MCQDWGNDPDRYELGGTNRVVLEAAQTLFRTSAGGPARESGPEIGGGTARQSLEEAFALSDATHDPQVVWSWRITAADVAGYEILALDNRTRRGFDTRRASPANLTDQAMSEQIPEAPPAGSELTLVIAPLPPIGFPPLEQIGQPYLNLLHDHQKNPEHLEVTRRSNLPNLARDYMFGRLIKDPEPWGFHAHALEELFRRLSSRRCVVFLSGDVHYSLSGKMTYWKRGEVDGGMGLVPTTRFIQLTSSALQNETGAHEILLAHLGLAQQFGAVVTGTYDRLGWRSAGVGGPTLPSSEDLSPQLRRLLHHEPVIVPTRMLPPDVLASLRAGTLPVPPEWAWRLAQVKDLRLDEERYASVAVAADRPRSPAEAELAAARAAGYMAIARHHDWHARHGTPRRFLMYSSVCMAHVEVDQDGELALVHAMYSWDRGGSGPSGSPGGVIGTWPERHLSAAAYIQHRIPLDPRDEIPPDREAT
ncbi:MAG: hypothetical protein HS111_10435 [Kofleriaceae bacterium]|nr:hypothetical protein [Kofleriaceae bacterium]